MSWWVYMIITAENTLYTGITTDVARRWKEHTSQKTGAKYFRRSKPTYISFIETQESRSSASIREAHIKKLTRTQKDQLITEFYSRTLHHAELLQLSEKNIPLLSIDISDLMTRRLTEKSL